MPLSLSASQTAFARALRAPETAVPENIVRPDGCRAERRFAIYRNNVAVSLIDAVQANFPVTHRLVGEDFFRAMAAEYVRAEIPKSPVLSEYGDSFGEFISNFQPARDMPYLAGVAAVELAWSQSYHAADAASLSSFESVNASELAESICTLHPSVRFVSAESPIGTIWLGHQLETFNPPKEWNPEFVMLVRPVAEVTLHLLEMGEFIFAQQLLRGASIEEAAATTLAIDASFDLGAALIELLRVGAITSIEMGKNSTRKAS